MLGPIVCGLLAQLYAWYGGFGAAALFILVGLVTYPVGYRHLPSRAERAFSVSRKLTAAERRRIRAICAVLAIVVCPATSYFQSFNTAAVWTQDHVNLDLGTFAIPVPWFNALDPVFSILGVPVVFALWRWQAEARAGVEPGDLDAAGDQPRALADFLPPGRCFDRLFWALQFISHDVFQVSPLANLGHAFASASRFRKAASPASDTSTHFWSGEASAS